MINTPDQLRLDKIPRLYDTEGVSLKDKLAYLNFFIGDSHWWILEYDGGDVFFGYAVLNGDYQMAELGYISFSELRDISIAGLEICCAGEDEFPVQKFSSIPRITANVRALL